MATDLATLAIKVDNSDVPKATTSLNSLEVAGGKAEASTQRLTRRMAVLELQARQMDAEMERAHTLQGRFASALGLSEGAAARLTAALGLFSAAQVARETIALADAYTGLHARIRLVTDGLEDRARVEAALFQTSQTTRTGLESNVALYSSLARSTHALGLSEQQLIDITGTVAKSFIVSGASVSETNAAVRQLGQAFASGVLRGDEFNSIAENAPRLQQALAQSLGVTIGQLRAMAQQGQLTSEVLAKGLLQASATIKAEFEQMPITVSGSLTQLHNAVLAFVGERDQVLGGSHEIAEGISLLARNLDTVARAAELVATVFAGRMVTGFARAAAEQLNVASAASSTITMQREAASNAIATAAAQEASAKTVIGALVAEQAELQRLIVLEQERAAAARASAASVAFQVTPTNTGAVGPAADYYGRQAQQQQNAAATAARTAALEAEASAMTNEAALEERLAAVRLQGVAAEAAAAEASGVRTAALVRENVVLAETSLLTRAAAASTGFFSKAMAALGGPIGVALIAAYAINAALDAYNDRVLKAAENTEEELAAYRHAIEVAHARAAAQKQEAQTVTALTTERQAELEKLTALNRAYRASELARKLLELSYDAQIQKSKDAAEHHGKELATLNRLTDAVAHAHAQQLLLNDQLERENRLRQAREANADALRGANENVILAGQDPSTAERTRNRIDELNQVQDAERRFQHEEAQNLRDLQAARARGNAQLIHAIEERRAASKQEYDEAVANAHKVAELNDEAITRQRRQETKTQVETTVGDFEAQTAGLRAMMAAELQGAAAVERMRVALAGEDVVRRATIDATARGTELTDAQAASLRAAAEEYERTRIAAEKLAHLQREVADTANQFFTDLANRQNPFPAIGQRLKAEAIRALSEAFAEKWTVQIGKVLGIEGPAQKQQQAAVTMDAAATKQLQAAQLMAGVPASSGGVSTDFVAEESAARQRFVQQLLRLGGTALVGYQTGYGIGAATQNQTTGALGGAASGALLGASVGGPVGALVGGAAGLVGGLLGARDAAEAAADAMRKMGLEARNAAQSFHNAQFGDSLEQQIDAINAAFAPIRAAFLEATGGKYPPGYDRHAVPRPDPFEDFQQALDDYARAIEQAKEDYVRSVQQKTEDYYADYLDVTGHKSEAARLRLEHDLDREREALVRSFGDTVDANEAAALAMFDQYAAAKKAAGALDDLSTAARNAPAGLKLDRYITEFQPPYVPTPASPLSPGALTPPVSPLPPTGGFLTELSRDPMQELSRAFDTRSALQPTTPPAASLTPQPGGAIYQFAAGAFAPGSFVFQGDSTTTGEELLTKFVRALDRKAQSNLGITASRAATLERI